MKKLPFLLIFILAISVNAQEKVTFPQDFKLDSSLLDGMVIAIIPEKYHKEGVKENPAVVEERNAIRMMSMNNNDIIQVYYEVYHDKNDDTDDAGVVVSCFISEDALQKSLPELDGQDNLAYLTKDNYLILVWSDKSIGSKKQIEDMVNYYQNKLHAKIYHAKTQVSTESVAAETEEVITPEY